MATVSEAEAGAKNRIMLWHAPRSVSSAFLLAMKKSPKCKVFMEPYVQSYLYSVDKQCDRVTDPPLEGISYKEVKAMFEQPFPGFQTIFTKHCGFAMTNKVSSEFLPDGYQHTFLLRHPEKTVQSLYHQLCVRHALGFDGYRPAEASYSELVELYEYATKTLGQPSIVIDAEDLCRCPERVLREYCSRVGVTYSDEMLHFTEEDKTDPEFLFFKDFFKDLMETSTFVSTPSATRAKELSPVSELPEVVQQTIQENIPLYEAMMKHKIHFD